MSHFGNVVVVEDSNSQAMLYKAYLSDANYQVNVFELAQPALDFIQANPSLPSVILLDLELPDMHGLDFLKKMNEQAYGIPVIVATGQGSMSVAVDAMRLGAIDFIEKPVQFERLLVSVNNAIETNKLRNVVQQLNDELGHAGYSDFIGSSLPMKVTYRIIESASKSKASVFITGESGTGKELCARAIHNRSDRADKPFIAVNCAAIPADIFESEMFGHVKGAFTGASENRMGAAEQANGGTLFLDEIGEMSLTLQAKILRFIQTGVIQRVGDSKEKSLDVRIVAATNRRPEELLSSQSFREDLYYRLNVIPIVLPPLREREGDVLEIANVLLQRACEEEARSQKIFSANAAQVLLKYSWPGNVRQLENSVRNMVVMCHDEVIDVDSLPPEIKVSEITSIRPVPAISPVTNSVAHSNYAQPKETVEEPFDIEPLWVTEKRAIENAIEKCDQNIPKAAALLEVSPSTLYRKIKNW